VAHLQGSEAQPTVRGSGDVTRGPISVYAGGAGDVVEDRRCEKGFSSIEGELGAPKLALRTKEPPRATEARR